MSIPPIEEAEDREFAAELKLRTVLEAAIDAIVLADMAGNIIGWNPGAEAVFGYAESEVAGKPLTMLMPERYQAAHLAALERLRQTGERKRVGKTSELHAVRKGGEEFPIEISLGTWLTGDGRFFCGIIRDVSERKALEEALRHAALHDDLTYLPNRALFREQLERAAAQAARHNSLTAVVFVDLDDFKAVNDGFGHLAGDAVLREAGERLRASVRAGDTVARFGGDEFVALLENLIRPGDAETVAARIVAAMREPFAVDGQTIELSASVGVAVRGGSFEPADILRDADSALAPAKRNGKARFEVWRNPQAER